MGPFHEFLAAEYQPDILVPFIEPYGAFAIVTGQRYDADEWMVLLQSACERVHAVAPEVKCAVYFGQLEEDRRLYERVCAEDSPVDVTGFSIYTMFQPREELEVRLEAMTEWMTRHGSGKPHWIFETGQSPLTMGGEQAQAGFVAIVMNWAARQTEVDGLCVFSLRDYVERMGLLASGGRPRAAWHTVKAMKSAK